MMHLGSTMGAGRAAAPRTWKGVKPPRPGVTQKRTRPVGGGTENRAHGDEEMGGRHLPACRYCSSGFQGLPQGQSTACL